MNKSKAHYIAFLGVMVAVIFVVLTLETYVFMGMLGINPAFLSLPLAIALCLFGRWKEEFVGGTIFGLCSMIIAVMVGYPAMINPLVSVLPRVLMGVVAYWVYNFVSFIFNKILNLRENKGKPPLGNAFAAAFSVAIVFNSPIEMACCAVLVPLYIRVMKIALKNSNNLLFQNNPKSATAVTESEK